MMNLSPQTVAHMPTVKMKSPAIYIGILNHKTNQSAKIPPITTPKKNRRIKTIKSVFSPIIYVAAFIYLVHMRITSLFVLFWDYIRTISDIPTLAEQPEIPSYSTIIDKAHWIVKIFS